MISVSASVTKVYHFCLYKQLTLGPESEDHTGNNCPTLVNLSKSIFYLEMFAKLNAGPNTGSEKEQALKVN